MRENGKKKVDGAASEQPENKQNKQTPKNKQESPKTPKTKGKGDPSGEELLKTKLQDDVELSPEIIGKFEEFGIKNIKDATVGDLIRAQVELSGYTMDGVQIAFTKVPGYYEKLKKYVFNDEEYENSWRDTRNRVSMPRPFSVNRWSLVNRFVSSRRTRRCVQSQKS